MTVEDIVEGQRKLLAKSQEHFGAFNDKCQEFLGPSEEEEEEPEEA